MIDEIKGKIETGELAWDQENKHRCTIVLLQDTEMIEQINNKITKHLAAETQKSYEM